MLGLNETWWLMKLHFKTTCPALPPGNITLFLRYSFSIFAFYTGGMTGNMDRALGNSHTVNDHPSQESSHLLPKGKSPNWRCTLTTHPPEYPSALIS